MKRIIESVCSPGSENFMSGISLLVKRQLADANFRCEVNPEIGVISTHLPEFAPFIAEKVLKNSGADQAEYHGYIRKLIEFLNGDLDSVSLDVSPKKNALRLLGKTYNQNLRVTGKDKNLTVETNNELISYNSRDFGLLGKRWFNSQSVDTIFVGQDKLPLLISDGRFHFEECEPRRFDFDIEAFRLQLQASFDALLGVSPSYYLWVILNLREILPLKRLKPNGTVSETSMLLPGHIAITNRASIIETINMLVHETSHLYFHVLHLSVPLVESHAPMHHSVLKNTKRPLQNLLLGYHAFVNVYAVLSLMHSYSEKMGLYKELHDHLDHVFNYLIQLETALEQNKQYLKEESGLVMFETLKKLFKEYN